MKTKKVGRSKLEQSQIAQTKLEVPGTRKENNNQQIHCAFLLKYEVGIVKMISPTIGYKIVVYSK